MHVSGEAEHVYYPGVLHCPNATQFNGTRLNAISVMSISKLLPSQVETQKMHNSVMCTSLIQNFTQIGRQRWKERKEIQNRPEAK